MQTKIVEKYLQTSAGQEADGILRSCVHCGFCTATCPTYQLLGDELDGPRGRIYLIKEMLEGQAVTEKTRTHLDRCLTCRSCETTCPSGVRYGRLVDIARELVEEVVPRTPLEKGVRYLLRKVVAEPRRFAPLLKAGRLLKPLLPDALASKIPASQQAGRWPRQQHPRRMLALAGCVQSVAAPNTNGAAARVLDKLGIQLLEVPGAGCCGAVSHHLGAAEEARDYMRRNIDAWWPQVEAGVEAIIITASGCGVVVKEYGQLLADDPRYAAKAQRISSLARDLAEVLAVEPLPPQRLKPAPVPVAFHCPCTLQHGQKLNGVVEQILQRAGFTLTAVADSHLCCGSAGTYSLLQPAISKQLLSNKLAALQTGDAGIIATANIGCQMQLASQAALPVKHWIELLDEALQ